MASTKASNDRVAWTYTDNAGNEWSISAKSVYVTDVTDGPKLGGVLADGTQVGPIPGNFRPRKACFVDQATRAIRRYIVCYTPTASAWTDTSTTLTLNYRGQDTVFERTKLTLGEKVNHAGAVSTVAG